MIRRLQRPLRRLKFLPLFMVCAALAGGCSSHDDAPIAEVVPKSGVPSKTSNVSAEAGPTVEKTAPANENAQSRDDNSLAQATRQRHDKRDEPLEDPKPAESMPRELWDVMYINGKKVGRLHTTFKPVELDGKELIEIDQQGSLSVSRFGTPVTIGMNFKSHESPDGKLASFHSTLKLGPLPNTSQGVVKDRSLETTTSSLGKRSTKTLEWNPEWGGFFAVDQSLRAKPMKPGETRKFKALMPLATDVAIADVTLVADQVEMTKMLEGERELLKIDVTMKAGGPHDSEQSIWIDNRGEVLKVFTSDMGGMSTFRTSREVAMRRSDAGSFDLGRFSTVPVGLIANAHDTKKVTYRVKLQHANPEEVFAVGGSQQVKSIDDHTADVTVIAIGPSTPAKLAVKPKAPIDEDLAANNLIQSDDRRVKELAASVLPQETDNWKLALGMESAVYGKMTSKNFSTAFATAAEVARSLEGDCTEHAVLLAAMCRARNIPARVAIGLVYYPPQRGFAFHMWNEVWTGDRWVPLDATLGRGGIGAGHLKLVDASLAGADSFSAFMPVAKVMGQLEIEVQDAQ